MSASVGFRKIVPVTTFMLVLAFWSGIVFAETYNVNATVPYDPPTQPAVIDSPTEGAIVNDVQQTITGTCEIQNPATVVSVWRNGSVLGSVGCVSGRFSIAVQLVVGQNTLIAKTANASDNYGPDSAPRTVTLSLPVPAQPLPPTVTQPTTPEQHTTASNQGGLAGLSLAIEKPFGILPNTKQATLRIAIAGGQQPYLLQLKWGDGSTESHNLTSPGVYEFAHTYLVHKTYTVYASVRDVLGSFSEYTYAIISGNKTPADTTKNGSGSVRVSSEPWRLFGLLWYFWLVLAFLLIIVALSYWLGYHRGKDRRKGTAKKQVAVAKKKKPKVRKK